MSIIFTEEHCLKFAETIFVDYMDSGQLGYSMADAMEAEGLGRKWL